ncbi:MAG TPA: recombinase RecT [Mesorhizobium sp.]|nr:recombinase RecT [Mesorhizobium sp.]
MDITEIERRVDRAIAAPIPVNADIGGLTLENMGQVMEFAKLMSVSGAAVPKYLRGNPGACLAICSRALRWQMDPFAVAEKSYMVVNKGEERVAFEAQLVHAVITARAPLKTRLRMEIKGTGDDRRCIVSGHFRGEETPHVYESETLGKLRDARGRNEYGNIKGSPLWDTQPEVQLTYSAVRQWCRLHASETLLGVYTPDELHDGTTVDVTPSKTDAIAQRLKDRKAKHADHRGFDAEHVTREAAMRSVVEGDVNTDEAKQEGETDGISNEPDDQGRQDGSADRADADRSKERSGGGVGDDREVVREPTGEEGADSLDQREAEERNAFPQPQKPKGKR